MIGANAEVISKAEDRKLFKKAMEKIGLDLPKSGYAYTMEDARKILQEIPLPLVIRPSFTMGGSGSGVAHDLEQLHRIAGGGLHLSPTTEVLLEESILGWKEYELELMLSLIHI